MISLPFAFNPFFFLQLNRNYFTFTPSIVTVAFVSANLFFPSDVLILQLVSCTFSAKKIPNGLSAVMFTFFKTRLDTAASGNPQINPARFPLWVVAVMFSKVMFL